MLGPVKSSIQEGASTMETQYERVIKEWCDETGMTPWALGDDMHVDIEGVTVGLIHDGSEVPETLHVYFDLGFMDYPHLHQKLLAANTVQRVEGNGYFGLHPDSGNVVYRVDVMLNDQTSGAELPAALQRYAQRGLELMRS